jgi:ribonuclease D
MNLIYITEHEQYEKAINELESTKKLCIDTETTGLDARISDIRLIQLCSTDDTINDRNVYVFDLFNLKQYKELNELIETREMLVAHNMNFDFQFLS